MTAADLHLLTGAYAVDALTGEERAAVERHLADCPACAREVREFTATAARLGRAVPVVPAPGMREAVLRRIAVVRQVPPRVDDGPAVGADGPAGRRVPRRPSRVLPAACLVLAAALGGVAVWQHEVARDGHDRLRQVEQRADALVRVLAAPDARTATRRLPGGAVGTVVVSRDQDRAAFLAHGMPRPPRGRVYQLWFADGAAMRPAGLMGSPGGGTLLEGRIAGAAALGITVEPAGGSPRPTGEPLAVVSLPG